MPLLSTTHEPRVPTENTKESTKLRFLCASVTTIFVFMYCFAFIWQGIDLTDAGYHIAKQQLLISGSGTHYGMIWLSDLIGGVWLWFIGDLGLWGARLGWVVVLSITALLSFWILSNYFQPILCCLAIMATAMATNFRGIMRVDYYSIPSLLLIASTGCILVSQRHPNVNKWHVINAAIGGCFLGMAIMCRFPLIVSVFIPFIPVIVKRFLSEKDQSPALYTGVIAILFIIITISICLLSLYSTNHLDEYLYSVTGVNQVGPSHSFGKLVRVCYIHLQTIIEKTLVVLFFAILLLTISHLSLRKVLDAIGTSVVYCIIVLFLLFIIILFARPDYFIFRYTFVLQGLCYCFSGFCALMIYVGDGNQQYKSDILILLVLASVLPVLIILGSGNGFQLAYYALWLVLPLVVLILPSSLETFTNKFTKFSFNKKTILYYVWAGMFIIAMCGFGIRLINPYRDLRNRMELVFKIEHPRLKYIYTNESRAESLGECLSELEKRTGPGDVILAYNNVPMFHYLTQTIPALNNPWPIATPFLRSSLRERLDSLGKSRPLPKVVVRALTNPGSQNWGTDAPFRKTRPRFLDNLVMIDEAVKRWEYKEVWSNRDFVILERQNEPQPYKSSQL